MIELLKLNFFSISLIDMLDVLVVGFIFYRLQKYFRNTRASRMFAGLIIIFLVSILVNLLDMGGMRWLIDNLKTVWVVAFVILFQPELRRLLVKVGQAPIFYRFAKPKETQAVNDIASASQELSMQKCGALIVIIQEMQLRSITEKGIRINAKISPQLLISVFNTSSPLHDGAVIIAKETIVAAKCILPLSRDADERQFGTRHLAAIGVTEDSDAIAVVVSEETGQISIAQKGHLTKNITKDELVSTLTEFYKGSV
ncbi:TIGR00159 family protein [bacterium]|nr:TIGR00159 family protein [bacterium]MBL7052120.1 TIGR00159 family protein [Candidatus Neomarinimicrobiota bacterium]